MLQSKKKKLCLVFEKARGLGPESHKFKFTEYDKKPRAHINSFPSTENHYSCQISFNMQIALYKSEQSQILVSSI